MTEVRAQCAEEDVVLLRTSPLAVALVCLALSAASPAQAQFVYSGEGIGAQVTPPGPPTGTFADSGPLPSGGGNVGSLVLGASVPGLLNANGLSGTASSDGNHNSSSATANVLFANLLGGLVQASTVQSSAVAAITPPGMTTGGTLIQVLSVMGLGTISVTGIPNQTVTIPGGLGTLVINEQTSTTTANSASITVNALHFEGAGADAGIDIIIAQSHADIKSSGGGGGGGQPVPEPSSVLLFSTALAGLGGYRWYRQKTRRNATASAA